MRKLILILMIMTINCQAQKDKIIEMTGEGYSEMKYIFARIVPELTIEKELYKGGMYVTIFLMTDPKVTPEDFSPGTEQFLDSYIVSITEDGDHYTGSKLYKIEGFVNAKILEIKESTYPNFTIKIEYGEFKNRKTKIFKLKGML
ncbi:MAG: hypothetical protein P8K77_01590 [Polaribacter sp.]|nr:hypothetical protein [Polaribacter sp.]